MTLQRRNFRRINGTLKAYDEDGKEPAMSADDKMREALEPFAALGGPADGVMPAYHDLYDDVVVYSNSGRGITAGDVRRARAALGIFHAPRNPDLPPVLPPEPVAPPSDKGAAERLSDNDLDALAYQYEQNPNALFSKYVAASLRELLKLRAATPPDRGAGERLRAAAQRVVDETDRIHDGSPSPTKYRAPYGAISELRRVLNDPTKSTSGIACICFPGAGWNPACQAHEMPLPVPSPSTGGEGPSLDLPPGTTIAPEPIKDAS